MAVLHRDSNSALAGVAARQLEFVNVRAQFGSA
jgi:hypothetical protein